MKQHHDNFRSLKDSTFDDDPVRRRSRGGRTGMVAAGNPDALAEAEGKKPDDKGDEHKKGGGRAKQGRRQDASHGRRPGQDAA